MDKQKMVELLKKVSADCDKSIEKGFCPDLNLLTIKKQIDDIVGLLSAEENKQEQTETDDKTGDLAGKISELSKEVTEKKETVPQENKPQEEVKPDEQPKKLDSSVQEPAQPLKQSSSVTEKPAGNDKA